MKYIFLIFSFLVVLTISASAQPKGKAYSRSATHGNKYGWYKGKNNKHVYTTRRIGEYNPVGSRSESRAIILGSGRAKVKAKKY